MKDVRSVPTPVPCTKCGYDIRQTIADGYGRCPECGTWHSRKKEPVTTAERAPTLRQAVLRLRSNKGTSVSIRTVLAPYGRPFMQRPRSNRPWQVVERHWRRAAWPLGYAAAPVAAVVLSLVFFRPGTLGCSSIREMLEVESFLLVATLVCVLRAVYVASRTRILTLNEEVDAVVLRDSGLRTTRTTSCPLGKANLSIHEVRFWQGRTFDIAFAVLLLLETDAMTLAIVPKHAQAVEYVRSLPESLQSRMRWAGPTIYAKSQQLW